ncbi:MAG: hypothetical protein R6X20_01905 [Phycisphaerae bacterium]
MSLINDALRRADMEQRQHDAGGDTPAPPALPPEETDPPAPKRRSPWTVLLGLALVILVGVVAYGLWWGIGEVREKTGTAVETASAAVKQAVARGGKPAPAPKPSAASTPPKTAAVAPETGDTEAADRPAAPGAQAAAVPSATADAAHGPTPSEANPLDEAPLDLRLSADAVTADAAAGTDAGEEQMAGLFNRMLMMQQAASRTPATGWQNAAAPGSATPAKGAGPSAEPPPATQDVLQPETPPPAPRPPVDTSTLKISSIMNGPDGGLAIINGRPVREGESVAGAKVVRIRNRTVEVEINGRRATVGL